MSKPKDRNGRELRVGDRVRCVSANHEMNGYNIYNGLTYSVSGTRGETGGVIRLKGIDRWWFASRFKLIEPTYPRYATIDDIPVTPGMVEWSGTMYGAAKQVEARFPFPGMSAGGRNTTCDARTVAAFESAESAIRAGMAALSNRDECAELEAELRELVGDSRIKVFGLGSVVRVQVGWIGDVREDEFLRVDRLTKLAALKAALAACRTLREES